MSWQGSCSFAFISVLLAGTASAGVFPSDSGSRSYQGIEMKMERLPPGVAVFFLGEDGSVTGKIGEQQTLTISKPGTVYAANQNLVSGRLTLATKRGKLYELKRMGAADFPMTRGEAPFPRRMNCSVTGEASTGYALNCQPVKDR